MMPLFKKGKTPPYQVIHWQDQLTPAQGWIVIDCLINGVSGGGLFMSPMANEQEVTDLAHSMSFKNALQSPQFGGGKGGIRFDPNHPDAEAVLQRFLVANKKILENVWCTGADLNTDNTIIHRIIQEDVGLKSGFHCLGKMLQNKFNLPDHSVSMLSRIAEEMTPYFPLSEGATGFSVAQCCDILAGHIDHPRIILQGFGSVGSSLAYFLAQDHIGTVVGISGIDGFIYQPEGIDIAELWDKKLSLEHWETEKIHFEDIMTDELRHKYNWQKRQKGESDEDFLCRFLAAGPAEIFCPCANRYSITQAVVDTLTQETFKHLANTAVHGYIVAGANNIFANDKTLERTLNHAPISFLPEWVSNCGNALLFMEALKTTLSGEDWVNSLKEIIRERLHQLISYAQQQVENDHTALYESIYQIIGARLIQQKEKQSLL
ncbi:MAG: Glu/Leu/Phe/Val dehydrogenase dimerization domain-containing protein [Flammeovirgaceae bacterium]